MPPLKAKQPLEFDGVDLLLIGAIVILALVTLLLLFPSVGTWCGIVLSFWNWPFWAWTCLGIALLCGLLWLRTRYS